MSILKTTVILVLGFIMGVCLMLAMLLASAAMADQVQFRTDQYLAPMFVAPLVIQPAPCQLPK